MDRPDSNAAFEKQPGLICSIGIKTDHRTN
jgi:hypothetical protein